MLTEQVRRPTIRRGVAREAKEGQAPGMEMEAERQAPRELEQMPESAPRGSRLAPEGEPSGQGKEVMKISEQKCS